MEFSLKSEFSFSRGIAKDRLTSYVILVDDGLAFEQIPHGHVCLVKNREVLRATDLKWEVAAVCISRVPLVQLVAIGTFGKVYVRGSGEEHTESIFPPDTPSSVRLRCGTVIGGEAYAAGMDRCVFKRANRDLWVQIDRGARLPPNSNDVVGFEGIAGSSSNDIYGVGWEGEIWHFDGAKWTQHDSPVNTILTCVCYAGDGSVYAAGRLGMLLVGRGDSWEIIDHSSIKADIWSLVWFKERLYVSTLHSVYALEKGKLLQVDFGEDIPATCYQLSEGDGSLYSIGAKDIMIFDGNKWERVV